MRVGRELISGVTIGFLLGVGVVMMFSKSRPKAEPAFHWNNIAIHPQLSSTTIVPSTTKLETVREPSGKYSEGLNFYHSSPFTVTNDMTPQVAENNFYNFVTRKSLDCQQNVRLGHSADGGWDLCIAPPFAPGKPCRVYSFGIANDWSFDDAISKRYGCFVRAFDPSMKMGHHRRSEKIWFNHTGIGGDNTKNRKGWNLRTLSSLFKEFGDTENVIDYLKIDVEFSEWESFESMFATGALKNVKQLGFEIHTKEVLNQKTTTADFVRYYKILSQLEALGFRRWFWHYNHFGRYTSSRTYKSRTCCYELVYININFLKT